MNYIMKIVQREGLRLLTYLNEGWHGDGGAPLLWPPSGICEVPQVLLDGKVDSGTVWWKALVVDFDVNFLSRWQDG